MVPGSDLRSSADRRGRLRHRRGRGAEARSVEHRRRRDRPDGSRRSASGTIRIARTTTRGSRGSSTTAERSCGGARDEYDLVIFALPDSLTLVSTSANLRLESFLFTSEAFDDVRDHLSPRRDLRPLQLLPRGLAAAEDRRDARGQLRQPADRPAVRGAAAATLAAGPLISSLDGGSPPGEEAEHLDLVGRPGRGHRRLAVPVPQGPVHRALLHRSPCRSSSPSRCCSSGARPHRSGTSLRRLQPALLRPRRRLPAPRDEEPRDLQPAVRNDVARQCPRVLRRARERPAGHRSSTVDGGSGTRRSCTRRSSARSRSRSCSRRRRC